MSFEQKNLKVFLSSSMAEFREQRTAIKQEFDRLEIESFVFEHEGASERPPQEIFGTEAANASVYIGVFGKICGKYTRAEFQTAQAQMIACHLYVQHLPNEERSEELKEFLESLRGVSNVPTVYYFQSSDKLVTQITKDLLKWLDRKAGLASPNIDQIKLKNDLPVLCDRDDQENTLKEQVQAYFQARSKRPVLLILQGHMEERPELYLHRVKLSSSNERLRLIQGRIKVIKISKSIRDMNSKVLHSEILGQLGYQEIGGTPVIVNHIRQERLAALLIEIRLFASECKGNPHQSLQLVAEYLATFPDARGNALVGVLLSLEEDESQTWWNRIFKRDTGKLSIGPFEKSLQDLKSRYLGGSKLQIYVLPRLVSPTVAHVSHWLGHDLVESFVPKLGIREIKKTIFQDRESLPMDALYPKLVSLLETKQRG